MGEAVLSVENLCVGFDNREGHTEILNDIHFQVKQGETLCIVGESGCGKSLTSLSIMSLLPPKGKVTKGSITFHGEELTNKSVKEMSKIRGNDISMIFQEPMTALNPVHTVGKQISEVIRVHEKVSKREAMSRTVELLGLVGIPSPEQRVKTYPHELSGGMRQRVMIAMALACKPKLLIADEPTTALDVTIQAQILEQLNALKEQFDMSIVMITHDLGVVSEMADHVLVMYGGKVVEFAEAETLFSDPQHPYTQGLIASIPKLDEASDELPIIKGSVPSPEEMPAGCRFATRCPFAVDHCFENEPPLIGENHQVGCWKFTDEWERVNKDDAREKETTA